MKNLTESPCEIIPEFLFIEKQNQQIFFLFILLLICLKYYVKILL